MADAYGGAMIREAPLHPPSAATRKALLTRVARMGAARMTALSYPEAMVPENL